MKMAMKDGQILIREADNVQFTIIKSWGDEVEQADANAKRTG